MGCCELAGVACGEGCVDLAAKRGALGVVGEAQLARCTVSALPEEPSEPLVDPVACRRRRRDDECVLAVDRDQLDRLEPDREHALADRLAKQCGDPPPVIALDGGWGSESSPDLIQVDGNVSFALAASLGEVGLLEDDAASCAAPPAGGLGGLLWFWGSWVPFPRARWAAGFLAGCWRGFAPKPRSGSDLFRKPRSGSDPSHPKPPLRIGPFPAETASAASAASSSRAGRAPLVEPESAVAHSLPASGSVADEPK